MKLDWKFDVASAVPLWLRFCEMNRSIEVTPCGTTEEPKESCNEARSPQISLWLNVCNMNRIVEVTPVGTTEKCKQAEPKHETLNIFAHRRGRIFN